MHPFNFRVGVAAVLLGAVAHSAPAATTTPAEVAAAAAKLSDPAIQDQQRLEAIERVLQLRRQLIADQPDDPHVPIWLADQASDLLFELLPHEGMGLTAMFGLPAASQHEQVRRAVNEAFEAALRAETAVGKVITNHEASSGGSMKADLQQLVRELAEVQRDRRIPYLRGVSACIRGLVVAADEAQQRTMFSLADQVLPPLIDKLQGSPSLEARLHAGLAKARLGQFDAAETLFAAVARDAAATPSQIFIARMGGVINRTIRSGARSGLEALASIEARYRDASNPANLFFRILIADHAYRLRRELADQADPAQRDQLLAEAFGAYTALLKSDLGASRETVRAIVFARLTNVVSLDAGTLPASAPGLVTVAYAEQLSRDPTHRREAIVMLEQAFMQERLDVEAQPAGLFVLARALFEEGERLFAARRFIELADRFPADHQAQRSVEWGVTIVADLHRQTPQDQEARNALRQGLAVLLEKYPNLPTINRWRYVAARLAVDDGLYDASLQLLAQITPDAAEWPDAHFMQAIVDRARAQNAEAADVIRLNQQVISTIERVQSILQAGLSSSDASRAKALRDYLGLLRVYRAEALLRMNQPQAALLQLESIEREPQVGSAVIGEALRVRISAYQLLRQPHEAQREIENFARTSPQQVSQVLPAVLASMRQDVEALLEAGRESEARELAASTIMPTAQLLDESLRREPQTAGQSPSIQHEIAMAFLYGGRYPEAAARYDRLLRDGPNVSEYLLGRAESLFGMGGEQQLADAMTIYKRLAATGPDANHAQYWLSQLRMLEILDRVNRNADQIAPRIERLRQQDRDFGGERFKRGFEALRMKYAGK